MRRNIMNIETVRNQFKALRLHTAATELEEVVSEHKKAVSLTWVSDLLEREIDARREKALMGRIKRASSPEIPTLGGFDWSINDPRRKQRGIQKSPNWRSSYSLLYSFPC